MRLIMIISGAVLLALGLISLVSPIPGGTLAITVGGGLIICASEAAANYIKTCRSKYSRFNRVVTWLENKMGQRLSSALRITRPEEKPSPLDVGSEK